MIAEVIVDVLNSEVDKVFDYKISTPVKVGTRVLVPFGKRNLEGYVLSVKDTSDIKEDKLKSVISVDDSPVLLPEMIKLIEFMTKEFNLRKIDAIRLMLPSGLRNNKVKQKVVKYAKIKNANFNLELLKKTAKNQRDCFEFLLQNGDCELSLLNNKFSNSSVKKLTELGAIEIYSLKQNREVENNFSNPTINVILTQKQTEVVNKISNSKNQVFLLFGVTGSGKTEVYINCIKNALNSGKTAIM